MRRALMFLASRPLPVPAVSQSAVTHMVEVLDMPFADTSGAVGLVASSGASPLGGRLPTVSRSGRLLVGSGVAGGGGENGAESARAGLDAITEQLK